MKDHPLLTSVGLGLVVAIIFEVLFYPSLFAPVFAFAMMSGGSLFRAYWRSLDEKSE